MSKVEQNINKVAILEQYIIWLRNDLKSQSVISNWSGRRYPPYAFTEQGVAKLSSVLRSQRAINVHIEIMRAFVRLRRLLESNKQLKTQLDQLEQKYDDQFKIAFEAIRQLMAAPETSNKRPIRFTPWPEEVTEAE